MSSISMDVPILQINEYELQNLVRFIYKHEKLLKEFGGIKIQLNADCKLALKKRRKNMMSNPIPEQIVKMSSNELIYSIEKIDQNYDFTQYKATTTTTTTTTNERNFWSSLSRSSDERRQVNISLLPNQSFFSQKQSRIYFDIHRLPQQSLLKLGGSKVTRQFVPCARRAHGPGAVFPLTSTKQGLFSIDYHHEGGVHHWYIIPISQREVLRKISDHKNSSICLEHGKLLIDPSVLDKHRIRYHRILQHPNEFVVLSAGTLAQSFTEDASWSESITFALPSWVQDYHASVVAPSCQCNISHDSSMNTIDSTMFRQELIQRYIDSYLDINTEEKSIALKECADTDMFTMSKSTSIKADLSKAATIAPTNMKPIIILNSIVSSNQFTPNSMSAPPTRNCFYEDDQKNFDNDNAQMHYKLLEEGNFYNASDWSGSDISLINSILSEHLSEQDTKTSEQNETTPTSSTIHRTVTNNCSSDNYFLPLQELMDSLHSTADKALSTHRQVNHNISTSCSSTVTTNTHNRYTNNRSHAKKKFAFDRIINNGKTLFVSGLRSDVDKNDIRSHFTGSIKVVIKQYRSTSHLKYAFVYHRTSHDAKNNIRRLINFNLLGDECHVEYANACSNISNDNQISSKRKLAIKKIPYNVSEDDLQRLFVNCRILKYCPARITYSTTRKMENKNKNESKILFGYAFIVCVDEQSAEYIITHVDQYKINGHLLDVSLYQNQRQRSAAKV
ncbi:unnamed protein product [Rotaria socialis]|uniref:RRM domain-containing protein n=1 Tax=Rotaria socialis TaxID=392032 RepID=A0A818HX36_9BILA|nr:unnamed protein product [Rotaria socialis]